MKIKIIKECSDYLRESRGNPLVRLLPRAGTDFRKIKVRRKKSGTKFDVLFNSVFIDHPDLRQRCIFANGLKGLGKLNDKTLDEFYVFPTDGYSYIYSLKVRDSSTEYKETLEKFIGVLEENQAIETFSEVLKYDYTSDNLIEGIEEGSEIILYGISYYYAIRKSSVKSYSTLFSL